MSEDEKYMKRCLELASNGAGTVSPNPMVGCCIVHEGEVLAEAFHHAAGQGHAEALALERVNAPKKLPNSTLYVNLEPCCHHGRTAPCSQRIVDAGVGRVVFGAYDPSPKVAGKGVEELKKAGIRVEGPILQNECEELNRRFITAVQKERPYLILKWAQSVDGYLAGRKSPYGGAGIEWITGARAQQLVHHWRAEEDAILVGSGTAMQDDPSLTVRRLDGSDPLRVYIDRKGELPETHKLLQEEVPTILLTEEMDRKYPDHVERIALSEEEDLLGRLMKELYKREQLSLIVEGGTKLLNSFLRRDLWDEARVFIGDRYLGDGHPAPHFSKIPDAKREVDRDRLLYFRADRS